MIVKYKFPLKRGGKTVIQSKTKNVDISGTVIKKPVVGSFPSRFGTSIHGVKIVYRKRIEGGTGRGGRIKNMRIAKIIQLPSGAFGIKIIK